ncbi:MAG: hypothetical protein DI563_11040 [Variovorax paradoxus]|uniref:Uncharacterized protein n=1 Tax=Variovorax paradoxus TaxID=34073 RepID=A0A2W5S5J8_VARPD|nr:MAG: hypothetical protein DI563_11040 [Variovorax paradoxus]
MKSAEAQGLALQRQLMTALREVVDGLRTYRITRATAAGLLNGALLLRHRDQQLQQPPASIADTHGFGYGAVLERIAFDFAGSTPLSTHVGLIVEIADRLESGASAFYATHRLYHPTKKFHEQ